MAGRRLGGEGREVKKDIKEGKERGRGLNDYWMSCACVRGWQRC
jgi:hypothetical protein